jgi:predicted SAM-dependent methyltransferase
MIKLNLGCGRRVLDGFINVDIAHNKRAPRAPEILSDVRAVPLSDGYADECHAYHVIEHFVAWEAAAVIAEWCRLLKPGGLLVLELPNLESACRNLLLGKSDQMVMWPLYGDPSHRDEFMTHRWGYTPKTIVELLNASGFHKVKVLQPQTHGPRPDRDMRVEGRKA